jgi:hypothetical protein
MKDFRPQNINMEQLLNLVRIVGNHIKDYSMSDIITYKTIMDNDIQIPKIPVLKQTCTGTNCICWINGIKDKCISYKTCLKCYNMINNCKC